MPIQQEACFDRTTLLQFLNEKLNDEKEEAVQSHIGDCQHCRSRLEMLAGNDSVWEEIQDHLPCPVEEESGEEEAIRDQQRALRAVKAMLAPTDNPGMIGRIGPYEVCGVIGRGSSGIVIKAHDPRLNRNVAIKLLAPVYSNIGSSRRRFEREGRAVASLNNPHVIPIHAVQDFQGTPYIVMQYLPDGSLQQRIDRQGPLSNREVVNVGIQIADGLASAHDAGIVHRDVKPANVLLESGVDNAMVTDFGLARVVDEATMTHSGSISGTPQYMSPEQARGESVDPRSDLFSLGSVLYAACTGHPPFRAKTVFGIIKKVCESEPRPIRESNPEISDWLAAFIQKLMAKHPGDRFQLASEVAELLRKELAYMQSPTLIPRPDRIWLQGLDGGFAVGSGPTPAKPVKTAPWQRRKAWKFIGIGAALLCVAVTTMILTDRSPKLNQRISARVMQPVMPGIDGPYLGSQTNGTDGAAQTHLTFLRRENSRKPRHSYTTTETIPVGIDETFVFSTNLGSLRVGTHDKQNVVIKIKHTVLADNHESANTLFKKLAIANAIDNDSSEGDLEPEIDVAVAVKFPVEVLTESEIGLSQGAEAIREEQLISKNSHHTNAEISLTVPANLNLDLSTELGPISAENLDGSVKFWTESGAIKVEDVLGDAHLETGHGDIKTGSIGGNATIETGLGEIDILDVDGNLKSTTRGGKINAGLVSGSSDVRTYTGTVSMIETGGPTRAWSRDGDVTVFKARDSVNANSDTGNVTVNFVDQPKGESRLASRTGGVKIGYSKQISMLVDASAKRGYVSAPFIFGSRRQSIKHSINNGDKTVVVTANYGSIKFIRIKEENLFNDLTKARKKERGERAFKQGWALHRSKRYKDAIAKFELAIKNNWEQATSMYNVACCYALLGKKNLAFEYLNSAVDAGFYRINMLCTDPDLDAIRDDHRYVALKKQMSDKQVQLQLARDQQRQQINYYNSGSSCLNEKRFEEAELMFRKANSINPDCDRTTFKLAYTVHMLGKLDESETLHRKVFDSEIGDLRIKSVYNVACVYALKGEDDKAFEYLEKAIRAGFTDTRFIKEDEDLKSIRSDVRFEEMIELAEQIVDEEADKITDIPDVAEEPCVESCERDSFQLR